MSKDSEQFNKNIILLLCISYGKLFLEKNLKLPHAS